MDAIVAVYADWGIGAKGTQPLVIPADRRRFRELTMGAAVIVGRRTLDDFPGGRPLPGRENLVLTRQNIVIRARRWYTPRRRPRPPPRSMTAASSSAETACFGRCSPT